ncbi:NAD(P)-binding protein [Viridothelium virens]|uniref:NADP-dependent mannitol dehydrogenase n=1 Tax=Viridothelium virens TaxID=1048519 RepID=A0A6A6H430_VIRVR|nr:NAD(P)-binding protein [Viridothelium virens]
MDGGLNKDGTFAQDNTVAPKGDRILPLFSLKGKTAIISGAGAGIGLAVAQALAEAGANVAIWYYSNKNALDRAAEIEKDYGVTCKAYQIDATDVEQVKKVTHQSVKDLNGRLDIFIANAGIPWTQGPALDGQISHYHKVVATDLDSVFYCGVAAAEHWRRQWKEGTDLNGKKLENYTYGSFVATASMSGHITNIPQLQAAYNAAKAGVSHLCKSFAVEWVKFARSNAVSPGYIATEISDFVPPETKRIWRSKIPMGREGEASELKGAFLYLASDAASYTTGCDIIVDGGYTLP